MEWIRHMIYNQAIKYAHFVCRTVYSLHQQSTVYAGRYVELTKI